MVVIVLAVLALGSVLVCEARDWARGAAVGPLWVVLALGVLAAAVIVNT